MSAKDHLSQELFQGVMPEDMYVNVAMQMEPQDDIQRVASSTKA